MRSLSVLMILVALSGCSGVAPHKPQNISQPEVRQDIPRPNQPQERGNQPDSEPLQTLLAQYDEWRDTRYQMGGLSKNGVDCSGFVHLTFQSKFNMSLPRTTERLATTGRPVQFNGLQTGDLVFFRINSHIRHVGIYLENGQFLHASKSVGVTISEMGNPYWQERFWQSRRVF